jgi:hypothetical protein
MQKGEGKGINNEVRDIILPIRVSASELELLTKLCNKRKLVGSKRWSRADVIVDSLKYSDGQIIF